MEIILIILVITTLILLIFIYGEVKKIRLASESSNFEIRELNASVKYLKRKFNESDEKET